MIFSIVITAYNASPWIEKALTSVFHGSTVPPGVEVDVIVVDDASSDGAALHEILARFPRARLLSHPANRGMCAARNTGLHASHGEVVTLLDADDWFADDWPAQLQRLVATWPPQANVVWTACRTPRGTSTVSQPDYDGWLTVEDFLSERRWGEYNPVFRGEYIRSRGYIDLGPRRECGAISYLNFALDHPLWISSCVLRIYDDERPGSFSADALSPTKARETAYTYRALLDRFGTEIRERSPTSYRRRLLRLGTYSRLAGDPGAWGLLLRGLHWASWREAVGLLVLLLFGRRAYDVLVSLARRRGMVKRYG